MVEFRSFPPSVSRRAYWLFTCTFAAPPAPRLAYCMQLAYIMQQQPPCTEHALALSRFGSATPHVNASYMQVGRTRDSPTYDHAHAAR